MTRRLFALVRGRRRPPKVDRGTPQVEHMAPEVKPAPEVITVTGKTDGFGAQYRAVMSGVAFCAARGHIYQHTPFDEMLFVDDVPSLNRFIGIRNEPEIEQLEVTRSIELAPEVHFTTTPSQYYTPQVRASLRDAYWSTPKPPDCEYDVAVHVRRGDVDSTSPERFTSSEIVRGYMDTIRQDVPGASFCVYSQGELEDFEVLEADDVSFALNSSIESTFHGLVTAKVLMTAKSSFSYSAALLSQGTIYYEDFWHKPLDHWIVLSDADADAG